jgi:hypothetical protein
MSIQPGHRPLSTPCYAPAPPSPNPFLLAPSFPEPVLSEAEGPLFPGSICQVPARPTTHDLRLPIFSLPAFRLPIGSVSTKSRKPKPALCHPPFAGISLASGFPFSCSLVPLFPRSLVPLFPCSLVPLFPCSLVPSLPRSLLFRSGPFCPLFTDHRRQVTTHHPLTTNH